jgi:hypothetical protein
MSTTIQIRRGLAASLPTVAAIGELLYATDTGILYIGTGTGVQQVSNLVTLNVQEQEIEGEQPTGTNLTTTPVNPVLIGALGTDGSLHSISVDATGKIQIANFPTTQAVSGAVSVSGSVSVSNLPTIQIVEISDGTNTLGVSAHPVRTDPTGTTTQPVSGTVAVSSIPTIPAGANLIGQVEVSDGTNVLGTSAHPVKVDPTGTTTQPVSGTVSINAIPAGSNVIGGVELVDSAGTNKASISAAGAVKVDGSAVTQPISGTATANQGTAAATASAWPTKITDGTNAVTVASLTNSKALAVEIVDGAGTQITSFGGGTQIADGTTNATPTGTVAMAKNGSNVIHALAVDSSGNLNVNVQAGGTGGNASVSTTAAAVPTSATMVAGSDGTNLRAINVSSTGVVAVDGSAVTQPVQGTLTNNNAAPSTTNIGVLPLIANVAPPSWTEGNTVLGSADLAGATRVTIRPPAALGFYSIGVGTGVYNGLAAGAAVFAARWGDATRLALILRVTVSVIQSAAVSTLGGRVDRRLIIARSFTASYTGGTTISLTGDNNKMRTSQGSSLFTDMRVASTAALTVGTRTLDSQAVGIAAVWANLTTSPTATGTASTTAHNRIIDKYDLFNTTANFNYPIVLAQNEGIVVDMQNAQPSGSSLSTFIEVQWAEVNAF